MNILIWTLSICIAIFQIVDYWTTLKVLKKGGVELNPLMKTLFDLLGTETALFITKFYVVMLSIYGAYYGWWESKIGFSCLILMFGVYGAVVSHNLKQYKLT